MNGRPLATVVARGAVVVAAAALAAGTWEVANGTARFTTYAGRSWPSAAFTVLVLAALTVASLSAAGTRPDAVVSWLPLLVAATWVEPVWAGWHGGSPFVRSAAYLLAGWLVAFVVHTCLRPAGSGPMPKPETALVVVAYGSAAVAAGVLALVRVPYLDPRCLSDCDVNVFLVSGQPGIADLVQGVAPWWVAAVALAALGVLVSRMVGGSSMTRRRLLAPTLSLGVFAAATATRAVVLEASGIEDPFDDRLFATYLATGCALVLVSAGLASDVLRRRRQRRAASSVVAELSNLPAPGSLQAGLARALADPGLTVGYWVPDSECWADAEGHPIVEPQATPGHQVTRLVRNGETTAIVRHTAPSRDLLEELGPAVLLGLGNEGLRARVLAKLAEIRMSRARIVQAGDAERRRLERGLHDGAQQRLLALSYDLRLVQASAAPGSGASSVLGRAIDETGRALVALRELAHGIYPAALPDLGLLAALQTLAESAPLPVDVVAAVDRRWRDATESAAYFAAVEAVEDAYRRGATYVTLSLNDDNDLLVVDSRDDGRATRTQPERLVDRVVASGGEVLAKPDGLRMVIPCA